MSLWLSSGPYELRPSDGGCDWLRVILLGGIGEVKSLSFLLPVQYFRAPTGFIYPWLLLYGPSETSTTGNFQDRWRSVVNRIFVVKETMDRCDRRIVIPF